MNEYINYFDYNERLSILIGENGSGKSLHLNQISKNFIDRGYQSICIANCVFDKFELYSKNIKFLGARLGDKLPQHAILNVLTKLKDSSTGFIVSSILSDLGFEKIIGFEIKNKKHLNEIDNHNFTKSYKHLKEITSYKNKHLLQNTEDVIWVEPYVHDTFSLKVNELLSSLNELSEKNADELSFSFYLKKDDILIPVNRASSGEVQKLLTILFIASHINFKSAIIIDEPENSLHPKWQQNFISELEGYFGQYTPKIIIATHSPLIVTEENNHGKIYKSYRTHMQEMNTRELSLEAILWDSFGVITAKNKYLSTLLVSSFNALKNKETTIFEVRDLFGNLYEASKDERQKHIIKEYFNIINKNI